MDLTTFIHDTRYSRINTLDPDPREFPLFYKAKKYEYYLNSGERLFIPRNWYHFVESEPDPDTGLNVAVNFWFVEDTHMGVRVKRHTISCKDVFEDIGQRPLKCSKSRDNCFLSTNQAHWYPDKTFGWETFSLDDFLEINNPQYYVVQNKIENSKLNIDENFQIISTNIWINRGNCRTSMHEDGEDNWLCQVSGRKRIILFPPSERPNLYTYNPYPSYFIDSVKNAFNTVPTFFNFDHQISNELVNKIQSYEGKVISSPELSDIYSRALLRYQSHLKKQACELTYILDVPSVNFRVVRVHCLSEIVPLPKNMDYTFIFCLSDCNVNIVRCAHRLLKGSVHASPGTFEWPIKLGTGAYVLPTKENITEIEDGPGV